MKMIIGHYILDQNLYCIPIGRKVGFFPKHTQLSSQITNGTLKILKEKNSFDSIAHFYTDSTYNISSG